MRSRTAGLAALMAVAWIGAVAPPSPACANKLVYLQLDDYEHRSGAYHPFYWAYEGQGSTAFTVERTGDVCDERGASVAYEVRNVSAQSGSDFGATNGRTKELFDPHFAPPPHRDTVGVPLVDDATPEPVEEATVVLSDPQEPEGGAHLGVPSSAPLYIVDDDAPADEFGFAKPSYSYLEWQTDVAIPVFRSGPATGSATMTYAIKHGTTDDGDFIDNTQGLTFDAGQRLKLVRISIINDGTTEPDESFTVTLTGPGAGGTTSTVVTIVNDDTGETQRPETKFHHPRHRHDYRANDWRVQIAWHIFARDSGGSEVARIQVALRKKMKSGSCSWLAGRRFASGPCSAKRWLTVRERTQLQQHQYQWLYVYDPKPKLQPSAGSSIRNYKIYSRATDGSGNVENRFESRRNANTFEVTR
ncbi:MAG: Calx-beta domain-containing protein [Actinomycetota bacterium]